MLEEKKSIVTGTLDWPHGDPVKLTGLFAGETLVFSGDSTGENFTIHIDATGTRKADGTLTGTLKAHFDESTTPMRSFEPGIRRFRGPLLAA